MRRTMRAAALAAALAVASLTGCVAGSPTADRDDTQPTVTPASSPSATPQACDWAADQATLAPLEDRNADLPPAVAMEDWVWDCVDSSWSAEAVTAHGADDPSRIDAQELDLLAPDGTRVRLFELRGDVLVQVVSSDVPAGLAWTARVGQGDTAQVVEVDLRTGEATEDWGDGAIPSVAIRNGLVIDVAPYLTLRDGTQLWAAYHYMGDVTGLFEYTGDGAFEAIPGAEQVEALLDEGSVNRWADPGVGVWVAPNSEWVAVLGQRQVGNEPFASSELGRWVAIDLVSGETRASTSPLPSGLCRPAAGAALQGTFAEPAGIPAVCWAGDDAEIPFTLSLTEAPTSR